MSSRAARSSVLNWSRNRGRNGWDVATDIADDMTAESMNVCLERGTLGQRRRGSATQAFSGDSFTGYNAVFRYVPGQDDSAAETFIVDLTGTTKILRVAAGSAAANLTLKDNVATAPHLVRAAVLNGKLYFAYDSTVNRLHVFAPGESTTLVRRAGVATPGSASVADTGSGTYVSFLRYYRVAWLVKSGSTVLRQSLLGPSVSFTPSGSGTHARITQPSVASEGETHWRVYGSEDDVLFYELADIVIGTTTYDDNAVVAEYDEGEPAPDEGAFTPFPSVKYLLSTGERLLGFGVWETTAGDSFTPRSGRVYIGPVLESTDADDDERISNTQDFIGWIDVSRNAGAEDRALAGPLDAMVFVFQSRGVWILVPTGDAAHPFRRVTLTGEVGTISQECTFIGEDEAGRACIYFVDPIRGPYRYGSAGLQWLGYDVQDLMATVNLAANVRVCSGVYDPELRACIFGLATGSSNVLSEFVAFFVREGQPTQVEGVRGGWVRWQEASASTVRTMAMLPETYGATMSRTLKPYFGHSTLLNRWNDESVNQDVGVSFAGYVKSKAYDLGAMHQRKRLGETYLQASAGTVTITQTLTRNFGDETARTATVSLAAAGSETRVIQKFEGAALADVKNMQVQLGDAAAANVAWTLDEWIGTLEPTDQL